MTREEEPGGQLLAETPEQDYVGNRDLTQWPTRLGRRAANAAVSAARTVAPHRLLLLTLLVGVVLAGALSALAAEGYDAVEDADGVAAWDQPALDLARDIRTPLLTAVVSAYTKLGGTPGMTILATTAAAAMALLWRQWTPVVLVAATAAGSVTITVVGKLAVGRARPPLADAVPPYLDSFSFPSGHATNSTAIAGMVAYLLVRRQQRAGARTATIAGAAVFAVAMGLSRVYLGLHWLTDVLVAWALGLAWLTVVVTAHRLFLTLRRRGPATREVEAV